VIDNAQQNRALSLPSKPMVFDKQPIGKRSLWNVDELADYLSVSPRTVRDWVYKRVIPFRKAGRNVRFDPEEIEKWTKALPNQE